jgi:hypothetical protein
MGEGGAGSRGEGPLRGQGIKKQKYWRARDKQKNQNEGRARGRRARGSRGRSLARGKRGGGI